jgi:transcriptional regulator with XRE-family HTH domain
MAKAAKPAKKLAKIDRYIIDAVRDRRNELGISQGELSRLVGRSYGYISQYESYKRGNHYNTKMINELAKALQCSPRIFWPENPL